MLQLCAADLSQALHEALPNSLQHALASHLSRLSSIPRYRLVFTKTPEQPSRSAVTFHSSLLTASGSMDSSIVNKRTWLETIIRHGGSFCASLLKLNAV